MPGIAYVDTSALLRLVLREPGALADLRDFARWVSSELHVVESLRTIDRLRVQGTLDADLATALAWRDATPSATEPLTVATHDAALALAARSCGFAVIGT